MSITFKNTFSTKNEEVTFINKEQKGTLQLYQSNNVFFHFHYERFLRG